MLIWQLILIQAITFLVIIIFLRLLFYQHLSFALKRLKQLQQENLEREITLNKELERAKQEREMEVEKGKEESKRLRESARQEAEKIKSEAALKSKQDADRIMQEASSERERLKKEAHSEIEESGIELAKGLIREIFSTEGKQVLHHKFVDELIDELGRIERERFKIETEKAQVISAYHLTDTQKTAIKDTLSDKLGRKIELEEKLDESIISGLIINLSSLVLDGSLQNKLRKLIPYLREER